MGTLPAPIACHCTQCRKQSGHFWTSIEIPRVALTVTGKENLVWYKSSSQGRRGFCSKCGSSLFWEMIGEELIEVAMGAFEKPTGIRLGGHMFTADKGDYYQINDGLPQS